MGSSTDWIRWVGQELYLTLVGVVVVILSIFGLLIFLPTFIWRPIAKRLGPYLRPDLGPMLSSTSSVFAQVDEDTATPTNHTLSSKTIIVMQATFKGTVEFEPFVQQVEERWIKCREGEGKNGPLRYPQLQQFITSWAGYKFWKNESNFKILDHFRLIQDQNFFKTQKDIHKISQDLLCGGFDQGRSPWDLTLVPGVVVDGEICSILFLRVHHALGDGYSMLFMFQRLYGDDNPRPPLEPRFPPVTPAFLLRLPCQVLRLVGDLALSVVTSSLWKIDEGDKDPLWSHATQVIPHATLLRIKDTFEVSFTAVVFALLSGGLHRHITQHKIKEGGTALRTAITAPVKLHPDNLVNKFSFALASYPVGISDPVDRLRMLHRDFEGMRNSPVPIIGYLALQLLGSHFNCVGRVLNAHRYAPLVTTYFPAGRPDWVVQGCPISAMSFYIRFQQGQPGAVFCILSHHDSLEVTPVFNAKLMSEAEVVELCHHIGEEAQALMEAATQILDKTMKEDKKVL